MALWGGAHRAGKAELEPSFDHGLCRVLVVRVTHVAEEIVRQQIADQPVQRRRGDGSVIRAVLP
jgi:hypothetical protein